MQRTTCDKCGREYGIGDSPYCRDAHGRGAFGYDAFTPHDDDMIAADPVHFGNRGEKSRYMAKNGIEVKNLDRWKRPGPMVFMGKK